MKFQPSARVRFGEFEVNLKTRELQSQNQTLVLQEQPYKVLVLLIERGGEIVTREEIREALWPEDINVNFEASINAAVKNLRNALNDSQNENPYIQTMPRQGYRLTVTPQHLDAVIPTAVENTLERTGTDGIGLRSQPGPQPVPDIRTEFAPAPPESEKPGNTVSTRGRHFWRIAIPIVVGAAVIVAVAVYYRLPRVSALTVKDTIVLADFTNRTGDPVFDDTLKQGLAVQLDQSPFLQQVSDSKVHATLKLMGRPVTDSLTAETTREVCLRVGGTAMVTGSIDRLGSQYVVGLRAIHCASGDALAEAQEQGEGKEKVLKALDVAAIILRQKIGESLTSVQRYATPVEEATTPSLEALKAYSLAREEKFAHGDSASLSFYNRAIELDPNFAIAYYARSAAYRNLNQLDRARVDETKAYELRQWVSDRERFSIEAAYYLLLGGDLEKASQTYELWQQTYPRDYVPRTNLEFIYASLGKLDKTLEMAREAMRLQPNDGGSYSNLGAAYQNLNRLNEAEAIYKQAKERKVEGPYFLVNLYTLAFLKGDTIAMAQSAAAAAGRPGVEDLLLATQADTDAWHGKFESASKLTQQAMDSALRNEARETSAAYQVLAALREVAAGERGQALADAHHAIKLGPNRDVRAMAALAMAQGGESASATALATDLNKEFPLDTLVQRYWLPSIRAAIALQKNDAKAALEVLATASDLDLSQPAGVTVYLVPSYLRGQAHLMLRDGESARAEFQKFIDHYGLVGNYPWGALARLGIARAYVAEGKTDEAKAAYSEFLGLWSDADSQIPIYRQAKLEYLNLGHAS